ncbi:MAG TPA: (Fe-S)-binding protein [Lutibacter sp.]|nr:(Fe-S)-binding protein [Lutibacter sp.]
MNAPTMAELAAEGKKADILFFVGCAGSYDDRAIKITKAFVKILNKAGVNFAILGAEETCAGEPAKRAGNEMLFQMQAMMNIEVFNMYEVKKIVTASPHAFNTLKNEYPELGGKYEVLHHTQFINELIESGQLKLESASFKGKRISYHDPCYLGRANSEYEAPRNVLRQLNVQLVEAANTKSTSTCCGAGGAQMFKDAEKGEREIFEKRTDEMLELKPQIIATACEFCNTMLTDGVKMQEKEGDIEVLDIAEIIARDL